MAYQKAKTNGANWRDVKGYEGNFKVCGDEKRFSIQVIIGQFEVKVNGCKAVEGKEGYFISFPSWVDNNKNWHNYAYLKFNQKESDAILKEILG